MNILLELLEEAELLEHLKDVTTYTDHKKFDKAVTTLIKSKGFKARMQHMFGLTVNHTLYDPKLIAGGQVELWHVEDHWFAAWDKRREYGFIDPDFKGNSNDLEKELKKQLAGRPTVQHA